MASAMGSTVVPSTTDASSMLNTQLASALSTLGDAQFWEETISPSTIRNELSSSDPSNPNSTPTLLKGMKWLLASISKGRDVSDFYPHVVKLVGATSLEVRKMVYMYLVQYADHDATTRELSLLSINSFQRGLADHEQLIRALALRVLSSIRIPDILQIQILGVQKCAKDRSPYVRKCAANALMKLAPRCDEMQQEMLLEIMKTFLDNDTSTMVLSSALVAFCELCPDRLELLHASYRKICHLLTDMDEWGQVAILEVLSRYCRKFFKEPRGWKGGTAERIDQERRVLRYVTGIAQENGRGGGTITTSMITTTPPSLDIMETGTTGAGTGIGFKDVAPTPKPASRTIMTRRVVQKGFYSDEEDESVEEEVETNDNTAAPAQRNILGLPGVVQPVAIDMNADEDMELDEDHKLLLQSAMPLLKSRNAGVVLGVCSLLYYCGVSSVKSRSAMGKALVRIHRGRREIQYVVLTSIRTLVHECPSAFAPFLNDFFVKALDAPHTRIIKIDILVSLALEPAAIEAVLTELRTYIRSGDKKFVCAALRAVGRVAELARIVYDRHGQKSGDIVKERKTSNRIALDCLYGLAVVTQTADSKMVIGQAVSVMQNILVMLMSDAGGEGSLMSVDDPNEVQSFALRRILLLLVHTLSSRIKLQGVVQEGEDSDEDNEPEPTELEKLSMELPPQSLASAIWLIGEWFVDPSSAVGNQKIGASTRSRMHQEILRLLARTFPELVPMEKEQAVHFASKSLVYTTTSASSPLITSLCEHILSMGRIDVNPDVKDRARMESSIIHVSVGLKHDVDSLDSQPTTGKKLTMQHAKKLLLERKPAPSFLEIEDQESKDKGSFRFGTLSSLVGHQARGTYLPLPNWGKKNSPKSLRDPVAAVKEQVSGVPTTQAPENAMGFYGPEESSEGDSSSDDSSSSESSDGQNADSESDSESDESSTSSEDSNRLVAPSQSYPTGNANSNIQGAPSVMMSNTRPGTTTNSLTMQPNTMIAQTSSDSESSDSSSSSSSSSDEDYNGDVSSVNIMSPREFMTPSDGNLLSMGSQKPAIDAFGSTTNSSSAIDDLKGLVMAPLAVGESTASNPDTERDSSAWIQLVRPELCSGLSVRVRYLRGPTKRREIQLKNLDPGLSNVVCLQVQFGNKKTDPNPLRRIRILPRSSPSGSIPLKKALCPPEIPELKQGQVSNATLCLLFTSASNRDGEMAARFDIKSSSGGGVPVDLRPSIGELLLPQIGTSVADFDDRLGRMQGFQRVVSKFQSKNMAKVPEVILKHANLTPVGKLGWQGNKLRLIGVLPASSDLVLVRLESDLSSVHGEIIVCCDHAVAVNSIMNLMKFALSS